MCNLKHNLNMNLCVQKSCTRLKKLPTKKQNFFRSFLFCYTLFANISETLQNKQRQKTLKGSLFLKCKFHLIKTKQWDTFKSHITKDNVFSMCVSLLLALEKSEKSITEAQNHQIAVWTIELYQGRTLILGVPIGNTFLDGNICNPSDKTYPFGGKISNSRTFEGKISSCLLPALNWSRMKNAPNCYLLDFFVPKCNYSQEVAGIFFF